MKTPPTYRSVMEYTPPRSCETCQYICIALNVIAILAAVFMILASHNVFPPSWNLGLLSHWGQPVGYASLVIGLLGMTLSVWQWNRTNAPSFDTLAGSTSWKRNMGATETEQTLEAFKGSEKQQKNIHRNSLEITLMDGDYSEEDRSIVHLISAYLGTIHNISISIKEPKNSILSNEDRRQDQYEVGWNLGVLQYSCPEKTFALGFTKYDIYPNGHSLDYIFGVGDPDSATGMFSFHRTKSSSFQVSLRRLLTLASHEFGHMRGLEHCTRYVCNMQGSNSLPELNATPLIYCRLDMEKICHLNGWTLKEGYEKQLTALQNLTTNCFQKGKQVDFSNDMEELQRKIAILG